MDEWEIRFQYLVGVMPKNMLSPIYSIGAVSQQRQSYHCFTITLDFMQLFMDIYVIAYTLTVCKHSKFWVATQYDTILNENIIYWVKH